MSPMVLRVVGTVVFFAFIFGSGYWMNHSGKPYNGLVFNVHKLVGLGLGVFLGVTVYRLNQAAGLGGLEWIAVAVTVLLFVALAATGGLLSVDKPAPGFVHMVHRFVPFLAVLFAAGMLYLLLGRG